MKKREIRHNYQQAQDLAYEAMDTHDPKATLLLCAKAIELDPRCVDALTIIAIALPDVNERIQKLSDAVKIAEEDLGGEEYLEENKGYFWGLLETRPYMRARTFLAQNLYEAGKINAAIKEYEALLELNPGDNQGLRYFLMGLYLETDNVDGFYHLQDKYDYEDSAVFDWSAVLEYLISGNGTGAEETLLEARKTSPYVEDYLLGRKPMPVNLPDYYTHGDENDAIICVDAIGNAWKKHPEAIRWLRLHQPPAKAKVGRNDPCPCGSGKKYKKCCLAKDEAQLSSMTAAEKALNEFHQAIEGNEFSSEEEIDTFIQNYNQRRDNKTVDKYEGLSEEQVYKLVNFPLESTEIVEFSSLVSDPASAPIAKLFKILVDAIGENGLKPTATGNLPRKLAQDAALMYWSEEDYEEHTKYTKIRSELDFWDLHVTRVVAGLAGLIRKYKGKFVITGKCRDLLKRGGIQAVYPVLLQTYINKFNWEYSDYYPEMDLVQHLYGYTLYLFHRYGDQWRDNTFYEDAFLRAFPFVLDNVKHTIWGTQENMIRQIYSLRCLKRFAAFLGLAEIDEDEKNIYHSDFKLRKTPLFDEAVKFHVG